MDMHVSGPDLGATVAPCSTDDVAPTHGAGTRAVREGSGHRRPTRPGRSRGVLALAVVAVLVASLAGCAWPGHAGPASGEPPAEVSASPGTARSADPSPGRTLSPSASPSGIASSAPTATATPSPSAAPTPSPSPAPPPEPTPEPTPEPAPEPAASEPPAPQYPRRGATGPQIEAVQQRLQDLGYFLLEVDGSYGWATSQAVWAFQKAAGLGRDGVVGPKTQAALDAGYRPTPRSSSGKVVEIDLDRQILMAVEDGQVVRIINASSGNGERYQAKGRTYRATTPRGEYSVYMQRDGMHSSTLELGDMWRPKYFTGGYAVHGSGSIPPYPASHGCVRVSNAAMNWLWDSWGVPLGTRVLVY